MSILIIVLIALIVITGVSSYFIISKAMARKKRDIEGGGSRR